MLIVFILLSVACGACSIFLLLLKTKAEAKVTSLSEYVSKLEQEAKEQQAIHGQAVDDLYKVKTELELKKLEREEFAKRVDDWEKSRGDAVMQAKAAIFETASKLSEQLITQHKTETKETEDRLATTTSELQKQFETIVNNIAVLNNEVKSSSAAVENVKNALLSPISAGNLAEITLENILKSSGLDPTRDFIMQYSFEVGEKRLRPDAVVFLPAGNIMIIDSKASKLFLELIEQPEETFDRLKATMRTHLKSLTDKDYKAALKESLGHKEVQHVSSVMFLPSDSAIEKLCSIDKSFMAAAWEKDIFPVGPSGLIHMLAYSKFQVSVNRQAENQLEIINEVKKLLHSVSILYTHAKRVGESLCNASSSFDKFAGAFNAGFLTRTRKLEKLGVHSQKSELSTINRFTIIKSDQTGLIEVEQESVTEDSKS
jgi:DNA recombination protein RmuC